MSRIPKIVHAEIVQGVLNDHKGLVNRHERRKMVAARRRNWRKKVPVDQKDRIIRQLKATL